MEKNKNNGSYLLPIVITFFVMFTIFSGGSYYYYKTKIIPINKKIKNQEYQIETLQENSSNSVSKSQYNILLREKRKLEDEITTLEGTIDSKAFIVRKVTEMAKNIIYESKNHREGYRNFSTKDELNNIITVLKPKVKTLKNGKFPIIVKIHSDSTKWSNIPKNMELSMKRGFKFIPFLNTLNIEEENNICFQYSKLHEKRSIEVIEITK